MQRFRKTPWTRSKSFARTTFDVRRAKHLNGCGLKIADMDATARKDRVLGLIRSAAGKALGGIRVAIDDESPLIELWF